MPDLMMMDSDANGAPSAGGSAAAAATISAEPLQVDAKSTEGDVQSTGAASTFSAGLSVDDHSESDRSDADSTMGDADKGSSKVSVGSSVYEFVEEYGRTFHKYKEGKYFLPNDLPEQQRLDLQHAIALKLFGGLALAPIDNPKRVLDLGTGTGIWTIEFANEHPDAQIIGTDLSPIQPEFIPPNCTFEIDDAEDDWVFSSPFDYIHSRFMVGAFSQWDRVLNSCLINLSPGGWAEFQEYYVKLQSVDGSLAGTALERWNDLIIEAMRRMGKDDRVAARLRSLMASAGFTEVAQRKFALPGNPWAKGQDQKTLGWMQMTNILDGLHGFTISALTKMMGMSVDEVERLLVDTRRDLQDRHIHFYYVVYSVYGCKPLSAA